jgi:uncharacterized Rossmann fold enzyme
LTVTGWDLQYSKILKGFGYSRKKDQKAAARLDYILEKRFSISKLKKMIFGKPVFVIGAGPSLQSSIPVLKKYKNTIKICADTALTPLLKNGIRPQIVVTDLDGDFDSLQKIGNKSIIIVHAHGDNIDKLEFAKNFKNCIGTTQGKKIGKIYNFGGFTDGDRCVFLSEFFGASKIFLFGMDFGTKIGTYSNTKRKEMKTKLKKLQYAKMLLEWLAPKAHSELFTLSKPIEGFTKITSKELKRNVTS